MTYEICRYIFFGGMILSVLSLIATIVLFFLLKIPNVIGDLTGANARKAIESIRNQNEQTGTKTYAPSAVNRERGKITEKMTLSGQLIRHPSAGIGGHHTAKISTQELDTEMLPAEETTVLTAGETTVLEETAVLEETTVLQEPAGETTVLDQSFAPQAAPVVQQAVFAVDFEITYIHTNEVIA